MKKRQIHYQVYNPKKRKLLSSILFFSVLLVVAIVALYFSLQPREIQLSPGEQTIDITARSLVEAIGECGPVLLGVEPSCKDSQGKQYTIGDLQPLAEYIGPENLAELKKEYVKTNCPILEGDANGDGRVDITDPITITRSLTQGDPIPCKENADFNNDGKITEEDAKLIAEEKFGTQSTQPTAQPTTTQTQSPTPVSTATPKPSASQSVSPTTSSSVSASVS